MIIFIQNLMNYQEISGFLSIFTFSFILHFVIFYLFNLFYPNVNILKLVNNNYYFFLYSLFVFTLFWYVKHPIYLEDVYIKTKIDNIEINISGDVVNLVYNKWGTTAAFVVGVRFASVMLHKVNIGVLPKIGLATFSGGGCVVGYKIAQNVYNPVNSSITGGITTKTGPINIEMTLPIPNNIATDPSNAQVLSKKILDLFNIKLDSQTGFTSIKNTYPDIKANIITTNSNAVEISETNQSIDTSQVLTALTEQNPDWRNQFDVTISSPLEPNSSLFNLFLDQLMNVTMLEFIILYLYIMFLFIIACKFIININNNTTIFKFFNKFLIGRLIFKFINYIINTWKNSSNIWLYYISFTLILFHILVIIGLLHLLTILTHFS